MTLTIPCLLGLEALVADEIKRLGLAGVRAENGRVHCEGTLADIPRLNIGLRCGARVLMELGEPFPAPDFEALFQGVLALPTMSYCCPTLSANPHFWRFEALSCLIILPHALQRHRAELVHLEWEGRSVTWSAKDFCLRPSLWGAFISLYL